MNFILIAVIVLGGIALISAVILYVCSKKFAVHEDPRIGQVSAILPGGKFLLDKTLSAPKMGSPKRRAIFDFGPVYLAIII